MSKKKILFAHHAGGFGGAPKSMSYIIKGLDQDKYDAHLLNIAQGPINAFFETLPCELTVPKKGIRPFNGSYVVESNLYHYLYGWFFLLPSIFLAYRHIKRIKPDLIHINSSCIFAFAIAAYLCGVKTICHVREPIRKGWEGWPLRFFCKIFVSGFIAISQFDLDSLQLPENTDKPYAVIYNFVEKFDLEPTNLESPFRRELGISKSDTLFLYLARFSASNGWMELIEMAKDVLHTRTDAHFVLVGANSEEHLVSTGHQNIHILKFRSDVDELLRASDVFVCPFTLPHFARGVIESAAYGKPSIGSNIGGVNELIKNQVTGFLYETKDDFKKSCLRLLEDEGLRKSMGLEAFKFAKENFDPDKNLKRTYEFYTNFIK
ncbi:MAG: glycosyltransferase family 4 protein [Maribacter sp.]|uniref:glycosyltransferase family 4 protein n=1 Tax=Maribacter sp. TaxID=1897614 RepID=UPI003298C4BB